MADAYMDGPNLTQADPAKMREAYTTYEITIKAANEAYARIDRAREILAKKYTGTSGQIFDGAVRAWLDKFQVVINNLTKMRDALGTSQTTYVKGHNATSDNASSLVTAGSSVDITNLL